MSLISVVIPAYNEEDNVGPFYDRMCEVLDRTGWTGKSSSPRIPSTDTHQGADPRAARADPRVKLLRFSRRFGQPAATLAGLEAAPGDAVVVIDCDLQDPPELIPAMVECWREGSDVVYAQRRTREGETLRQAHRLGRRLPRDQPHRRGRHPGQHG